MNSTDANRATARPLMTEVFTVHLGFTGTRHGMTDEQRQAVEQYVRQFDYVEPEAGANEVDGRLLVVGVSSETASARIVQMDDVVFRQGLAVRLTRKMR